MTELVGADYSHHQNGLYDKYISDFDFLIHKLTEGTSYIDNSAQARIDRWAESKPMFVYHFLKSTKNIKNEMEHFLNILGKTGKKHTLGIAIDFECVPQPAGDVDIKQIEKGMEMLEQSTTAIPILYCGDKHSAELYQMVRSHGWGLWIARYRNAIPDHACDFWQHNAEPYDKDIFFGNIERLKRYIRRDLY